MSAFSLAGKRALVTGAADGIGRGIVDLFTEEGATVLAVDVVEGRLRQAHKYNKNVFVLVQDVTAADAPQRLVDASLKHLGGLDILVNNAGVVGEYGALAETTDDTWHRVMAVNVDAVFKISRAFIPLLKKSKAGRIINTASVVSNHAAPTAGSYVTSKHAIVGLTNSLAVELGEFGITANCIRPGSTVTGLTRDHLPKADTELGRKFIAATTAIKRYGQPRDLAGAALYLASDLASYVTASSILVDGGLTAQARDAAFWVED